MHFMRVLSWMMSLTMVASGSVRPIGVAPVEYAGDVPEYFQQEIERSLSDAIERAHGEAVLLPVESCTRLECLQEPAARAKLEVVLMSRVTKADRDYRVEIVAHAVHDGTVLARVEAECSVCGQQELLDAIPAEVVELHAKLAAALAARATPPVSDEPTPGNPTGEGRGLRIGGGLAVALGLAGIGTGVALLVLDGREHGPTCSPELVDVNGTCPNVYTTAAAGYVGLGLGLAAIGVGAGLLIHARRRPNQDPRIRVTTAGINVSF